MQQQLIGAHARLELVGTPVNLFGTDGGNTSFDLEKSGLVQA